MNRRVFQDPANVFRLALVAALLLALVTAAVKGNSLDEFWTLAFANSHVPWRTAFEAWTLDSGHPVGYYSFSRLLDPLLLDNILVRRLTNLIFIAALLVFCRIRQQGGFAWFFAFILLAQPYLVERFAEYRATFGGLMCLAILLLGVRDAWQRERADWAMSVPGIALVAAMLLDYPVGLAGVATCAAWALAAFTTRRYGQSAVAAGSVIVGIVTMGLGLLNASRYPLLSPPYTESALAVVKDMAVMMAVAAAPLCLPIAANLAARRGKPLDVAAPERITFLTIAILALAMTFAGYFIINAVNHGMIRRQLIALSPLMVAVGCEVYWRTFSRGNAFATSVAIVCPLLLAACTPFWLHTKTGFDTFGKQIAAAQRACPTLSIYGIKPADIGGAPYPDPFTGIADPVEVGLPLTAETHGFRLAGQPRKIDPTCGAIVWTEFFRGPAPAPRQIAERAGIAATQQQLAGSRIAYVDLSFALMIPGTSEHSPALFVKGYRPKQD